MIVLIDADSLIWSSCYKQKETPECTGYHNIEEAKDKYNEVVMKIINTIELDHEVDKKIIGELDAVTEQLIFKI